MSDTTASPFIFDGPQIPNRWIDHNGHVNFAAYAEIFRFAARQLSEALGLTREFKDRTNTATFAAKMNISYLRELRQSDSLRIEARVVGFDSRRVHGWFGLTSDGAELAATCEVLWLNIDTNTRRVADMAAEVLAAAQRHHAAHLELPALRSVGEGIDLGS